MTYPLPQYQDYLAFRTKQLRLEVRRAALEEEFPMVGCCLDYVNDDGYSCPECGKSFYSNDLDVAEEIRDIDYHLSQVKLQLNLASAFGGVLKLKAELGKGVKE